MTFLSSNQPDFERGLDEPNTLEHTSTLNALTWLILNQPQRRSMRDVPGPNQAFSKQSTKPHSAEARNAGRRMEPKPAIRANGRPSEVFGGSVDPGPGCSPDGEVEALTP